MSNKRKELDEKLNNKRKELKEAEAAYNELITAYKKKHRGTLKFTDEEASNIHNQYDTISSIYSEICKINREIVNLILSA